MENKNNTQQILFDTGYQMPSTEQISYEMNYSQDTNFATAHFHLSGNWP